MVQVYVSSTYEDLKECRERVREQLQRMDLDDVAMETYTAGPERPVEKCLEDVARCDLYLGIFAWRYGYVPEGEERSITELEYRTAVDSGKDVLVFLLNERARWPRVMVEDGEGGARIKSLREELGRAHTCEFFTNEEDLAAKVASAVATRLGQRRKARRDWEQTMRALLAVGLTRDGQLPRVRDVDPYGNVGVSPSRYTATHTDPYVAREVDERLDEALAKQQLVVVVGRSKAGKSRTALEAVRRTLPDAVLLVPKPEAGALGRLIDLDPPLPLGDGPVVVWLDNLDQYLPVVGGLDLSLLERLANLRQHTVVVGTIQTDRQEALRNTEGDSGVTIRRVLNKAEPTVTLSYALSDKEAATASQLYPQESFQRGIGVELAAAYELERRYRNALESDGIARVGWALVQAAVDWRRCGLTRPIPERDLRQLYREYLPLNERRATAARETYARALTWALQPPAAAPVALLENALEGSERAFRVFDYIVACGDGQGDLDTSSQINLAAWRLVIDRSTPEEMLDVIVAASPRGIRDAAEIRRAMLAAPDPKFSPRAMVNLGSLLEAQGDLSGARSAYEQAIAAGHDNQAPNALAKLASLLEAQGDLSGARSAYEQAIAAGYLDEASKAGTSVGGPPRSETAAPPFAAVDRQAPMTRPLLAFISYAVSDGREFANRLANELRKLSPPVEAWIDTESSGRYRFAPELVMAIGGCDVLLFVMTRDSVRSIWCQRELGYAMETGKRVLPLLKDGDAESTLQLAGLPRVDFTKAWDAGWRELQQALAGIASPEARREELEGQRHIFARKLLNAKGASRDRYQRKVAEVDARLQAEQQREREPVRVDHAVSIVRVVNEPPLLPDQFPPLLPDQFVGRRLEIQRLEDHLRDPSIGLVAVVGPAGIGKTSMIVRLIYGLRKDPRWLPVDALVYLTANGSRPIGPATILEDLCRVLPDQATAARLGARLNDAAFAPSDTLDEFLEALRDTRVVVVIDNAEELLDTGGRLRDPELDELLRVLLSQRDHRVKLVLVTHAPPISILRGFPVSAAQVDLASGLPPADAGRFLRSLDSAGTLGLDSLSGEQLDQVYRLTDGNPRALEMVFSVLESDPEASLPELLEEMDRSSTDKDVLSHLISRVFDRLDLADRRVLQALAVYGRPVPPAAVDYLLRWYLNGHQSEPTLRRLAEMRLVRREGGSFYLPRSPDRDQLLGGIPRGNAGDLGLAPPPLTRVALLHLAAEYFVVARKRRVERIDDLSAQLNEIDLRIQGQDYGTALRLISAVDDEYLSRWHYSAAVAHWRQQLIGKLPDPALELRNLYGIASARQQQDDLQGAIGLLLDALTLAKQLDDPPNLVRIQITLGGAYFEHGQISKAAELYQLALNAARAQRLQLEEARARGGLLVCLGETGRFVGALEQHAAALTVIQELQDSNSLTLKAELLVQSGWIYGQLGQTEEALASLRRGRELSRLLGDQVLEGRCLADEADVLIHDGRLAHAIELAGEATTIAASARSPRLSRQGNSTLALAYLAAGDLDAAREAADTAARHRRSRRALRALAMQGITALRQGEREKAQLAFLDASVRAETLRDREHRSFAVLDLHGAVLCGLVRCGDRDQLDRAISAYRTARAVTRAPGAVRRSLRLLDELGWDGEGSLAAARHAASGR